MKLQAGRYRLLERVGVPTAIGRWPRRCNRSVDPEDGATGEAEREGREERSERTGARGRKRAESADVILCKLITS